MLRADAIATLYFFRPLRSLISSGRCGVPILMYHSISDSVEASSKHPYYQTVTSPRVFEDQMKFLRDNGFSSVGLGDAVRYLEAGGAGKIKPVVITFDDGFRDFLTNAFPVLERYGLSATMFLPTGFIGESTQRFKGIECLTWGEVRDLDRAGVEFGSHTVTHRQLRGLDWKDVEVEVRSSKATIEERLGCETVSFAYPYAFPETDRGFTERLRALLHNSGYCAGVTTVVGTAYGSDRYQLRRLPVNGTDHRSLFRAKVGGSYDWLHTIQYASKLCKDWRAA